MRWTLYRSARAESPHFGRCSFWTFSEHNARWFTAWEARTLPELGPSRIYRATVEPLASAVLDLRTLPPQIGPNKLIERAEAYAEQGIEWIRAAFREVPAVTALPVTRTTAYADVALRRAVGVQSP